jgi:hypothetical protein
MEIMKNGQKLKATLVDNIRRAYTEDACAKENPSGENRSDPEAHRRCYSAKGVQPWIIARFTSGLISGSSLHKRSPASGGAFLMVQLSRRGMNCLALQHTLRVPPLAKTAPATTRRPLPTAWQKIVDSPNAVFQACQSMLIIRLFRSPQLEPDPLPNR